MQLCEKKTFVEEKEFKYQTKLGFLHQNQFIWKLLLIELNDNWIY